MDFFMREDKNGVCSRCVRVVVALRKVSEFFSKGFGPCLLCCGVSGKFLVIGDGFTGDGVNDWCTKMFTCPRNGVVVRLWGESLYS